MKQFIPIVTEKDIQRIVERDYDAQDHEPLWALMGQVEVKDRYRVIAACLKVGKGRFIKASRELFSANGYWREIISHAEQPNYRKKRFKWDTLSQEQQQEIMEKDKNQYQDWFYKK